MTGGSRHTINVNRAPVLTLWGAVVAARLGFTQEEALTLGRAVAGLNAYSKGVSLGLIHPAPKAVREQRKKLQRGKTLTVALLGRAVPVVHTPNGLRALTKDTPDDSASVARYLEGKVGGALPQVRSAMAKLARSFPLKELATRAYSLYETFRPAVPMGTRGGGPKASSTLRGSGRSPTEVSRVADGLADATPWSDDGRPNSAGRRLSAFATIGSS